MKNSPIMTKFLVRSKIDGSLWCRDRLFGMSFSNKPYRNGVLLKKIAVFDSLEEAKEAINFCDGTDALYLDRKDIEIISMA